MEWTRSLYRDGLVEWTREDGCATIRRRRRPDGRWIVRFDRLFQASAGGGYHRERVDDLDAANELVAAWKREDPIE
ncbi:DUF7543 family protein [Halobellus captivus]|uniref:DUF7543 family protein n=1 Tax=Halobellus captivus TaxID=2592614 RepID=UPI0011AB2B43|nr:hypothetical protein [Halobellus captivus]